MMKLGISKYSCMTKREWRSRTKLKRNASLFPWWAQMVFTSVTTLNFDYLILINKKTKKNIRDSNLTFLPQKLTLSSHVIGRMVDTYICTEHQQNCLITRWSLFALTFWETHTQIFSPWHLYLYRYYSLIAELFMRSYSRQAISLQ